MEVGGVRLNLDKAQASSDGNTVNIAGIKLEVSRKASTPAEQVLDAIWGSAGIAGKIEVRKQRIPHTDPIPIRSTKDFKFQVGANGGEEIVLSIDSMDAEALGLKDIDVSTQESALKAIDAVNKAIGIVSNTRSSLGAIQNRLEHTIRNLDNIAENLTAAESGIRDTDMAKEATEHAKSIILSKAANAMLAQGNSTNQSVLALLE